MPGRRRGEIRPPILDEGKVVGVERWKVILNGRNTVLTIIGYLGLSQSFGGKGGANVILNEKRNRWLLFYTYQFSESDPKEYYFFEEVSGKWKMIADLSGSDDPDLEVCTLMLDRFGLELIEKNSA